MKMINEIVIVTVSTENNILHLLFDNNIGTGRYFTYIFLSVVPAAMLGYSSMIVLIDMAMAMMKYCYLIITFV